MGMKNTIANVVLGTDDDVIIVDAEREYSSIVKAFGGEVIEISYSHEVRDNHKYSGAANGGRYTKRHT